MDQSSQAPQENPLRALNEESPFLGNSRLFKVAVALFGGFTITICAITQGGSQSPVLVTYPQPPAGPSSERSHVLALWYPSVMNSISLTGIRDESWIAPRVSEGGDWIISYNNGTNIVNVNPLTLMPWTVHINEYIYQGHIYHVGEAVFVAEYYEGSPDDEQKLGIFNIEWPSYTLTTIDTSPYNNWNLLGGRRGSFIIQVDEGDSPIRSKILLINGEGVILSTIPQLETNREVFYRARQSRDYSLVPVWLNGQTNIFVIPNGQSDQSGPALMIDTEGNTVEAISVLGEEPRLFGIGTIDNEEVALVNRGYPNADYGLYYFESRQFRQIPLDRVPLNFFVANGLPCVAFYSPDESGNLNSILRVFDLNNLQNVTPYIDYVIPGPVKPASGSNRHP